MTGPGLVTLPIVAQSAGWLPTLLAFMIIGILSTLSSLFICEAMTEVPGNEHFQSNVEFSNLILCFFGKRYHLLVQIICFLAMQTTNIASIAVSAQLFDNLIIKIFHRTCGIQVHPSFGLICVSEQLPTASPFTGVMVMTAGVLLSFSMVLPLGLLKLSENIWVQLVSFVLILLIVLQWIVTFFIHGLDTTLVPTVGPDISQTFGNILFNYAFITTVPSWANAKQPSVSIHKTVSWGVGITTVIYVMVAILGGMAYQIPANSSLIQAIGSSPDVTILSQITGYAFPIAALIASIPINIIVIRYNLIQSGACSLLWANVLSGVLPWIVAIPCMTGSGLTTVINWSSLILVSTANFIIPFVLYIYSKRHREKLNKLPVIEMEQHARLSREMSRSSFSGFFKGNTSIAGSIRRRPTGSSIRLRSQSHPNLTIAPSTGIVSATVVPVALGIGSSGFVSNSIAEEGLPEESVVRSGSHRRYHTHHTGTGPGLSNNIDTEELISGPYFSFSRDGELFDREPSTTNGMENGQYLSSHRPSGPSTVILHDPVTEMAQRRVSLPRRISHRDKLLSMLSEKHKRTIEQQSRRIQEEQNEKPVPPMILLSQSSAPEEVDRDLQDGLEARLYAHSNEKNNSESYSEKDAGVQSNELAETNLNLSVALKKLNSNSAVVPENSNSRSMLKPLPLSPSLRSSPSMTEPRGPGQLQPESPYLDTFEHSPEPSPILISRRSPTSPPRVAVGHSLSNLPSRSNIEGRIEQLPRPSVSLPPGSLNDSYGFELPSANATQLRPETDSSAEALSLHHSSDTPDLAASIMSLEQRGAVFSCEPQGHVLPTPELDRKRSFGDETKRVVRAAVSTLTGGGLHRRSSPRQGSSLSSGHNERDEASSAREWKMTLIESHENIEEGGSEDDQRDSENDSSMDILGPELNIMDAKRDHGLISHTQTQCDEQTKRSSLGRMATAFVSQPGSFSIRTALPTDSRIPSKGGQDSSNLNVSALSIGQERDTKRPHTVLDLSPSAPPSTSQLSKPQGSRNHERAVSASATLQDRTSGTQNNRVRTKSTQSLKDGTHILLTVPDSANSLSGHLAPPSPSFGTRTTFDALPSRTVENRDRISPLASGPPSPQRLPLHHRASSGGRSARSSKTLAAPFQSGNNYSIHGFGSNRSANSPVFPPSSPRQSSQDGLPSAQGVRSSWFSRDRHSRDSSRSAATSDISPHSPRSIHPSPGTSPTGTRGVGRYSGHHLQGLSVPGTEAAIAAAAVAASEAAEIADMEWQESRLHESNFYLPQYTLGEALAFDAMWSLRAIPDWIPLSGMKVAWGSLSMLVVTIGATIVYDFVELGLGKNVMS
ncbi:hypothetical protein BGZ99_009523 [Dissophora globulifera]|uniref:Amino acid transporter transmembrane domain-containing protein n=1 Tax=Dissophora globulifera TaxID=979702 RepID=A0A9P6UN52_9FUNG|nr:hypothetical protein BGZ99_009523 [Dissophora globulifera]